MIFAIALIILAAGYRLLPALDPALVNFSPLMALAFCGAVYFRKRLLWLLPLVALSLSDIGLHYIYAAQTGYGWDLTGFLVRTLCFVAAIGLGWLVSRRKNWLNLFSGVLAGSLLFYLATNTVSWAGDPAYLHTLGGWWQAMTLGHPEFPPTLLFFRNSLVSDLLFTGVFALTMEYAALRAHAPSLLHRAAPAAN